MTEWTKQTEAMFNSWNESQKKLMESWSESLKGLGALQDSELWGQTIATWEETAQKARKTQSEWMLAWIENLRTIEGMPEVAVEAADRFKEMSERWAGTQEQLWDNWFGMLRSFDPSKLSDAWAGAFKSPFEAWQRATERVMKTQSEWLRTWTGSKQEPEEE